MYLMRFDLRAPGRAAGERAALYGAVTEMAAWAEEQGGCASIALSEHHASDDGYLPSPLTMAAAVAAVTKTTPIVVAAALLPLYDPVRLAEELITLDHLSQGRVMTVLGIGYRPVEYELHGVDFARRGAIADEKLSRLLELLRDAGSAGAGGNGSAPSITPPPFSQPMPMISWGGQSKAAARRAGRHGLGFFAQTNTPGLGEAYEAACRENGFEPGLCMLPSPDTPMIVFVNDDLDTGWDEVGPAMLADAIPYHEWNEAAGSAGNTASLSSGKTVAELREANGAHRVVTGAGAADIVATYGMLGLHPLCGGLDPAVAWPYLQRAVAAVNG